MKDFGPWDSISPEAKLTLLIARFLASFSDFDNTEEFFTRERLDWKKFNQIIFHHEISPAAYIFLKKYTSQVPKEELDLLEKCFHANILRLTSLQQELSKVIRFLQDENITTLPLKGAHFLLDTGVYGSNAYLRPMADIDILIRKEDYPKAQIILESQGYQIELKGNKEKYWLNQNCNMTFVRMVKDNCFMVEVHWAIDYPRNVSLLPHLWKRIQTIKVEEELLALLSPEDNIFSLALHQRRFGNALQLKRACDVAILLTKYKEKLNWSYMLEEAGQGKMRTILYFILLQAEVMFAIQISPLVLERLGVPDYKKKFIKRFILKDTFSCQSDLNSLYLKAHLILYDNFKEPVRSILNIPQEQFAKFFKLSPYSFKTNMLYHFRWFYFVKESIVILYKRLLTKLRLS